MMLSRVIPAEEFARRRRALMKQMGEGAVALFAAAPERPRNRDVEYPYRQESSFYYLTGFPEAEAVAVLVPGNEKEYILFCRQRDPEKEVWTGRRAGPEGAMARYGADEAHPIQKIDEVLPDLLANRRRVFYALGDDIDFDRRVIDWMKMVRAKMRTGVRAPTEFVVLDHLLYEMRLHKHSAELAVMREAARISGEAHVRAMQICRPGMMEYEIEAEFLYAFARNGAGWAYPPIVGGGANSCILHYTENNAPLNSGDLLLIDAGAELDGYAADITRTFPVNGRFSAEQRAVYQLVLSAQRAVIDMAKPGVRWNELHDRAVQVLTEGLVDLGLLAGDADKLIEEGSYKRFYMHRTGHWLGMDVHDVGDYSAQDGWRALEPGMVFTVEPGLYIAAGSEGVDERWWNIGVRIEDDVAVTETGCEVITEAVPKAVEDIEALMAEAS